MSPFTPPRISTLLPPEMSFLESRMIEDESEQYDPSFERVQLARQFSCIVSLIQPAIVLKQGPKVRPSEEIAMSLARHRLPHVPIPLVSESFFRYNGLGTSCGELKMNLMPGQTLKSVWLGLDMPTKDRICRDVWDLVAQIRTIPPPDDLAPGVYRTVDGSPSMDPLLGDNNDIAPRDMDDESFRSRIYSRYVAHNGLSYRRDQHDIRDILPRSGISVFAHGDINPRNLLVDENIKIVAVLDWESSGWYPDYWEYARMMKYCDPLEHEWQQWMEKTKPQPWDITGIQKARRVLF